MLLLDGAAKNRMPRGSISSQQSQLIYGEPQAGLSRALHSVCEILARGRWWQHFTFGPVKLNCLFHDLAKFCEYASLI
jgi:hypothetical protein